DAQRADRVTRCAEPSAEASAEPDRAAELEQPVGEPGADGDESAKQKQPSLVPAEGDVTDPDEVHAGDIQNYRKLYETELRRLALEERVHKARFDAGPLLMALCFDQELEVLKAILQNDRMSLDHARLIAAHHRNSVGLELLTKRVSILSDAR